MTVNGGSAMKYAMEAIGTGIAAFIGDGIVTKLNVPFLNEPTQYGVGSGTNYEYITYLISLGLVGAGAMSLITKTKIMGFGPDALFAGAGAGVGTHYWQTTGSTWF